MEGTSLGPYRIDAELGSGGMGRVFAATVAGRVPGIDEGARVALKVVHPHLLETPGFFRRFMREADLGVGIRHENVVRTYLADALVVDGAHHNFIVMEYVEGQTLRELLAELGRAPEELCRHIGHEVARGLAAIHGAGVIHRDVKPENVLITADHRIKVMDLGVARLSDEAIRLSRSGMFVGSLHYAAPEQFRAGGGDVDHRADLHALGLVLYELACGLNPFDHDHVPRVMHAVLNESPRPVAELNPQLSPFFEEVVHRLLAKERDARFQSAAALADVLAAGEESAWWRQRAHAIRSDTRQPLRRIHIPRETAVYGRDADLSRMRALYERAAAGDGQVLLLEGVAGIGKTRLVDEFVGRLRQDGENLNFLFGSYPPGGAATAAGGFSTAYREQFGAAGLAGTLQEYLRETPVLVPAFAALLRGEPSPEGHEPLTKDSLQTVFVHATRALAAERPTIVLIDDLHFAPQEGRALFAALGLALPGHRVLLIGTARPGAVPAAWTTEVERREHATRITLERLFPRDLVALLYDSLRSERLAEDLAGKIAVKSDGNPFFVFEILRGLREGQFLTQRDDGTWATTRLIEEIQVPASVQDLVNARVSDLGEDERNLLDVAACCGFEFDPLLVADVLGIEQVPAMRRLAHLERRHRIVRSAGRRFVFDHHQVQEALYRRMPVLLREPYHAAIGDALERRAGAADADPSALDGALAVDLCHHFLAGARGPRALPYLDAALAHFEAGYLGHAVVGLVDRVLTIDGLVTGEQRAELLIRKAPRLWQVGKHEEQRAALEEALAIADGLASPRLGISTRLHLAEFLRRRATHAESLSVLEVAREHAEAAGDAEACAEIAASAGLALYFSGRLAEALPVLERAIEILVACEPGRRIGWARASLGMVLAQLGRLDEAREHFEQQLEVGRRLADRHLEAAALGSLGMVSHLQARPGAHAVFERQLSIYRETGHRVGEGHATCNLGNALVQAGHFEEAVERMARGAEIAREIDLPRLGATARANLGALASMAGRRDEAEAHFAAALSSVRQIGARREIGGILLMRGTHEARWNEDDAAVESLRESVEITRDVGDAEMLARALVVLGAVAADHGEEAVARDHLEEGLRIARDGRIRGPEVLAGAHLATLSGGDAAPALAALRESEDAMEAVDSMEARFVLFRATGDPAHLAEAHRRLLFLRDHVGAAHHESILDVPFHRDIVVAWAAQGGG